MSSVGSISCKYYKFSRVCGNVALKEKEKFAASHMINGPWEEVQKQTKLEKALQKHHGDCLAVMERVRHVINEYKLQVKNKKKMLREMCSHEKGYTTNDGFAGCIYVQNVMIQSMMPLLGTKQDRPRSIVNCFDSLVFVVIEMKFGSSSFCWN